MAFSKSLERLEKHDALSKTINANFTNGRIARILWFYSQHSLIRDTHVRQDMHVKDFEKDLRL